MKLDAGQERPWSGPRVAGGVPVATGEPLPPFPAGLQPAWGEGSRGESRKEDRARALSEPMLSTLLDGMEPSGFNAYDQFSMAHDAMDGEKSARNAEFLVGGDGGRRSHSEPPSHLLDDLFEPETSRASGRGGDADGAPPPSPRELTSMVPLDHRFDWLQSDPFGAAQETTRNEGAMARAGRAQVKRSRSADPVSMLGASDYGSSNFRIQLPGEDPFQLRRTGTPPRERPKRRRSAPTFSQDFLEDIFDEPGPPEAAPPTWPAEDPSPQGGIDLLRLLQSCTGEENGDTSTTNVGGAPGQANHPWNTWNTGAEILEPSRRSEAQGQRPPGGGAMFQAGLQMKAANQWIPNAGALPSQQINPSANVPLTPAFLSPQQNASGSTYVQDNNHVVNRGVFVGQQVGDCFARPVPAKNGSSHAPPPLSIDNSDDLTLVFSALKETETNLQTLKPLVIQLADPKIMEDMCTAFQLTALSSQSMMASDLSRAYAALNEAWMIIKRLEERIARGPAQQGPHGLPNGTAGRAPPADPQPAGGAGPPPAGGTNLPEIGISLLADWPRGNGRAKKGERRTESDGRQRAAAAAKPGGSRKKGGVRGDKPSSSPSAEEEAPQLTDLPPLNQHDPQIIMKRLKGLMDRTQLSQKQLQVKAFPFFLSLPFSLSLFLSRFLSRNLSFCIHSASLLSIVPPLLLSFSLPPPPPSLSEL